MKNLYLVCGMVRKSRIAIHLPARNEEQAMGKLENLLLHGKVFMAHHRKDKDGTELVARVRVNGMADQLTAELVHSPAYHRRRRSGLWHKHYGRKCARMNLLNLESPLAPFAYGARAACLVYGPRKKMQTQLDKVYSEEYGDKNEFARGFARFWGFGAKKKKRQPAIAS